MLLHVFVGDAQLETVPRDTLQLRLILSGDVRQGGREFSVNTNWKEGALVRFQQTQVMGPAEDKGQSTIHFTLKGTPKDAPGTEVTIGEAVLSTYAMGKADAKVVMLLPPGAGSGAGWCGDKSNGNKSTATPVGRLSVTLFSNRFAVDFGSDDKKGHFAKAAQIDAANAQTTATTSSREYAFLLNRRLNWKGEKAASFNRKIESKLNEDMTGHMKELRASKKQVDSFNRQLKQQKVKRPEPALAYGTKHAPPPPRALSPTRKTNMGVGFIAAWPRPQPLRNNIDENGPEKIAEKLRIAEARRQLKAGQEAAAQRERAYEARVKADEAKRAIEQQKQEEELRRLTLQMQEEAISRLRAEHAKSKQRTAALAVQAHFREAAQRAKLKQDSEEREKIVFIKTLRASVSPANAAAVAAVKPYVASGKSKVKVPVVKIGRPTVALTAWAAKQRKRADRARRVRERLAALRAQLSKGEIDEAASAALLAQDPLAQKQFAPRKRFMQSIGKVKVHSAVVREKPKIISPPPPAPVALLPPKPIAVPAPPVEVPAVPAPTPEQVAEAAAAKALERYKLAMQRKRDASLQKVARSSLYGSAYDKTNNQQKRSRSAPPSSRAAANSRDWAAVEAGLARPAMRDSVLRPTQSSKIRQAEGGGRFSDFELDTSRERRSRTRDTSRSRVDDNQSIDTEALMREFSREVFKKSSGLRAARPPTAASSRAAVPTTGKKSRAAASQGPALPKAPLPAVARSARSRSLPPATSTSRSQKSVPVTTRQSSPYTAPASSPVRPSSTTKAIASAWRKEARSAIQKMTQKSKLLQAAAHEFTLAGDLGAAETILQAGMPAASSSSKAQVIPGFLQTFNQPELVGVSSTNAIGVSGKGDGRSSRRNGRNVDQQVEKIVHDLVMHQASSQSSADEEDLLSAQEDEARIAEMIHALSAQGINVEQQMMEKVRELKSSPPRQQQSAAAGVAEALSPMSNLKATLRDGLFGADGEI